MIKNIALRAIGRDLVPAEGDTFRTIFLGKCQVFSFLETAHFGDFAEENSYRMNEKGLNSA